MKKNILYTLLFCLCAGTLCCQEQSENEAKNFEHYKDAKFGLFIHWGLYSVPAGVWNGQEVPWLGEHIMRLEQIPVAQYETLAEDFNPVKFSADDYVDLAHKAGMKYLVITAKHHDGFAMFDSEVDGYNIVDATPYKRDIVAELASVCQETDMPFGVYYSQAQDWHHPNGVANTWDFPMNSDSSDYEKYVVEKALPQVKELTKNYGPLFLVWFDTPVGLSESQAKKLAMEVKHNQPETLVTDRIGFDLGSYAQMGDNAIPTQVKVDEYWETAATLNDTWGFKSSDNNWKNPHDLIFKLTDIVSKGGNYLLNIGPDGSGTIPQESVDILTTMGEWLDVNGEAIYETSHSPFYIDNVEWRCTQKRNTLYFHILDWNAEMEIKGLKSKVISATLLENNAKVNFEQNGDKLVFTLPKNPLNAYNNVIKVKIEDEKAEVFEGYEYSAHKDTVTLFSLEARYRGEGTYYDWDMQAATNLHANMYWYIYDMKPGNYRAEVEYACDDNDAGSKIIFASVKRYFAKKPITATDKVIEGTNGKFKTFALPDVEITEGFNMLGFAIEDKLSANAKISKITLYKK